MASVLKPFLDPCISGYPVFAAECLSRLPAR
jgi:hypothetical protein